MIQTIILALIVIILLLFIVYKNRNTIQENYIDVTNPQPSLDFAPYFNPYFTLPTNCIETLFNKVECFHLPERLWENDWWVNR